MTEVTKNKGKKEESTKDDLSLEDEFEEYLKKDIPELQPED